MARLQMFLVLINSVHIPYMQLYSTPKLSTAEQAKSWITQTVYSREDTVPLPAASNSFVQCNSFCCITIAGHTQHKWQTICIVLWGYRANRQQCILYTMPVAYTTMRLQTMHNIHWLQIKNTLQYMAADKAYTDYGQRKECLCNAKILYMYFPTTKIHKPQW